MNLQHWLIYLSVVAAIIATPGPSAALCVTHGASQGKYRTIATVLGGMLASMILMSLSAMGLGAVITTSDTLFQLIKFTGALYLVFLGITIWRSTPAAASIDSGDEQVRSIASPMSTLFRQGFVVGIANPKDLLFFGALFPQFLEPSLPIAPQVVGLAATWLAVDGLAMFSYAALGSKIGPRLSRLGASKAFNRISGSVFIAAGGALASTHK
jgi:threonine/homoserine/homoserine lactone efflux protein